ncbi:MAG: hypothetical protein ACLSTV_00240 [Coriobacteriales bacterium]|jgi:hypothetical protein
MEHIYLVQFDWSTTDADGIETELYEHYNDAFNRFQELIANELNPELSWVGEQVFSETGKVNENYELYTDGDFTLKQDLSWHVVDKNDYYRHSFIDLIKKEVY